MNEFQQSRHDSEGRPLDLEAKFPDMTPAQPPSLWSLNGCGTVTYGRRDFDPETGSHVTTQVYTLVFLPIWARRAFRVIPHAGAVYILGRVPVSVTARFFNVLVCAAIVTSGMAISYSSYVNSDGHRAAQRLTRAREQRERRELAAATHNLLAVATSATNSASAARDELGRLLDDLRSPDNANQAAEVLTILVGRGGLEPQRLFETGWEIAQGMQQSDPQTALLVLASVESLAEDPTAIATLRESLLLLVLEKEPDNPSPASQLAEIYEATNRFELIEPLLAPCADRLADSPGARILGQIYARQGKHDESYALLLPYTESRLKKLHEAESRFDTAAEQSQGAAIHRLESNQGPPSFYSQYETADEAGRARLLQEYVGAQLERDPQVTAAREAMIAAADIVPTALDLGVVLLGRARDNPDPAARRADLEKAEEVFVSISGFASETNAFRFTLGQVYYWLGKQTEGRKLFDELLGETDRQFQVLVTIADLMRDLGITAESRTLSEEAYGKASDDQSRFVAAHLRALCSLDLDDKVLWLGRCDVSLSEIQAQLHSCEAQQAELAGRHEEAAHSYREAIRLYESGPEHEASLNNAALMYRAVFGVSGDTAALNQSSAMMRKALAIDPKDSILIHNTGRFVLEVGLRETMQDQIEFEKLWAVGSIDFLPYLSATQADRDRLGAAMMANSKVQESLELFDRVMLLAPKRFDTYSIAAGLWHAGRNESRLEQILARIAENEPDLTDSIQRLKDYYAGINREKTIEQMRAAVGSARATYDRVGSEPGIESAIAASILSSTLRQMAVADDSVDSAEIVQLAEQAHDRAAALATARGLVSALLTRSSRRLADEMPRYAEIREHMNWALGDGYLLAYAMSDAAIRDAVLDDPDFVAAMELAGEWFSEWPAAAGVRNWSLMRWVNTELATEWGEHLRNDRPGELLHQIEVRLMPIGGTTVLEKSWRAELVGDMNSADVTIDDAIQAGVPLLKLN